MKNKDTIAHEGKIIDISPDYISVEILNKSACASCHAKGVCAASDESIRIIEVPYSISTLVEQFEVGETVNILLKSSLGLKAVWISYVIPLAILLTLLLVLSVLGYSEIVMGLGSIIGVAVYYFIVFLFRNKISKVFTFVIEKINK
ncbi:MAG: SoxR reducing system RseC family protein [Bacteroidales bacterium]|nr:SoxR reducing system RseC family protein [Bacteroidales bacterium]MDD4669519.1 SoxR reducing system RseC family protein [Bacteroidales bacterium]